MLFNQVNDIRLATDTYFLDETSEFTMKGMLDKAVRFVERFQLLDPAHWRRFVRQFEERTDSDNHGWRGEFWGKMMRGAAFTYATTKNEKLYAVLRQTVIDMMNTADDDGRISSYRREDEFSGWDIWCRKYVLLGMQYFLEVCPEEDLGKRILDSMKKQADYLLARIGDGEGQVPITSCSQCWRGLNSSSVLEPMVRLYDLTGEKKYLDFAGHIVRHGGTSIADVFKIAMDDIAYPYQYPVTKAYEMISCFEGLLEFYRVTGEEKYKNAVVNFAKKVAESDITVIGSAGCTHELFDHSALRQTDTEYQGIMQETCVTVTWMKFCMQLLLLTGDSRFADAFEQSAYNAYLGAFNTDKKVSPKILQSHPEAITEALPFDSYSPLLPGVRGESVGGLQMMKDRHVYGCCACIGSAGVGMFRKVAVMKYKEGLALNLYEPFTCRTEAIAGVPLTLTCTTSYPKNGKIVFTVSPDAPASFGIRLRIPAWSEKTSIAVNGEKIAPTAGYTEIVREWKAGDRIELSLDMRARVIRPVRYGTDEIHNEVYWQGDFIIPKVVKQSPDALRHIALRRGPIVLAKENRLGESAAEPVDIACDKKGFVKLAPAAKKIPFTHTVAFEVPEKDGTSFTVVDYASAGKTWSEESSVAAWFNTKNDESAR
ncbi:MAG: glycoside hydrolase family 127 protein [Clostridia bacterium]|nr:glycoside hydrolase family 127 protein [Clostridia bacterium]